QPVDAHARRALPSASADRSPAPPARPRVPLHAQARELAEHGGDRDRRPRATVPGPTARRRADAAAGDCRLESATQPRTRQDRLALRRPASPREDGPPLPQVGPAGYGGGMTGESAPPAPSRSARARVIPVRPRAVAFARQTRRLSQASRSAGRNIADLPFRLSGPTRSEREEP